MFIHETGLSTKMGRRQGRSRRGVRIVVIDEKLFYGFLLVSIAVVAAKLIFDGLMGLLGSGA